MDRVVGFEPTTSAAAETLIGEEKKCVIGQNRL
jgi:hypothetical protein